MVIGYDIAVFGNNHAGTETYARLGLYLTLLSATVTEEEVKNIRDALKLPSSSFSFYESPHGLKIATVGKGHGFGMSQWTAQEMAKDGKNYEEILQYFYEGTELHHIDE